MYLMTIVFVENTVTWTSTAVSDTMFRYYYIYNDSYEDD